MSGVIPATKMPAAMASPDPSPHATILPMDTRKFMAMALDPGAILRARGFTVERANGVTDPRDLSTNAHWWHTGVSGIALRVVYDVLEPDGTDCSAPGATQDTF